MGTRRACPIIMFSDLETDYLNPIDFCNKMNQVCGLSPVMELVVLTLCQFILPEGIAHAFLTLLFLHSGQWSSFIFNLPLVAYNVNKYALDLTLLRMAT